MANTYDAEDTTATAASGTAVMTRTFSPEPPEFLTTFRTDRTALSVWCIGGVITMLENHVQCVGSVRVLALCVMDPANGRRTDVFRDIPVFVQDRAGMTPESLRDALQQIKTVCAQWRYVRDKPLYKELQHKARAITLKQGTHTVGTMDTAPHITFTLQSDKYLTMHLRLEYNRGVAIPTQLTCRPPNAGERLQEPIVVWANGYDRDTAATGGAGGGMGATGGGPPQPAWNVVV